jgi:phosphatidylserine/phosphatidylglycerophosphate/cardiolipin synthase-like enzyme
MKKLFLIAFIALATTIGAADLPVWVYFSPHGGCTEAVVRELDKAHSTIYMQAYSFTSKPIAEAMVNARKRGVKVQAIVDKSQRKEKYTEADFLAHSGITTYIDAEHAIAHNKIIIIDEHVVITGSFNFTTAAEKSNAENLLVITDAAVAARYLQNWREHEQHSAPYAGR